uniref:Uncharacterized protein n=1 Tax=Anguilla anguilla TaxID=7936 RepID=A0A0E9TQV0_ANGAN
MHKSAHRLPVVITENKYLLQLPPALFFNTVKLAESK